MKGKVVWFNNTRGYGFISPEDNSKDVFVHFSDITSSGYKTLKEGQAVEFDLGEIEKQGKITRKALDVRLTND